MKASLQKKVSLCAKLSIILLLSNPTSILSTASEDQTIDALNKLNTISNVTRARIKLTSKALNFVDGVKGAMDEYKIRDVVYIGREINKMQYGEPDKKDKLKRVGMFKYKDQLYSLKDLVKLEASYVHQHPGKDPLQDPMFKETFEKIIFKFRDTVRPYLNEAKRFKKLTLELIKEYCGKTKKPKSHLLTWQESDNEQELFKKYIKSHKDLDIFCTDLTDFMETMIHNCPKGYKKYLAWKVQQKK